MDSILVRGGRRLQGDVVISGSKNAALPILMSSLLTAEPCSYQGIPDLRDIYTTSKLLTGLGVKIESPGLGQLTLQAETITNPKAHYDLVKTMRASILVLGPLL